MKTHHFDWAIFNSKLSVITRLGTSHKILLNHHKIGHFHRETIYHNWITMAPRPLPPPVAWNWQWRVQRLEMERISTWGVLDGTWWRHSHGGNPEPWGYPKNSWVFPMKHTDDENMDAEVGRALFQVPSRMVFIMRLTWYDVINNLSSIRSHQWWSY